MNTIPPFRGSELFTLDAIVQSVFDFEELIRQKQNTLRLPPGSPIEAAGLAALQMMETFKREVPRDMLADHRHEWRQAVALGDMLRKVQRSAGQACFDRLWPHIMLLLGKGNIALNLWNPREDSDANKIFELYVALVLAPFCISLEVEDPVRSAGGKNPDVIAHLDGVRWAFACKVMHSDSPKTFLDRVEEGIDQIDRSDAAKGIVVISLKNLLPHEEYWHQERQPSLADFLCPGVIEPTIVTRDLVRICRSYHNKVIDQLLGGSAAFNSLFNGTKAVPAILLHLCTTVLVPTAGSPNFCLLRMFSALTADPLSTDLQATLEKLNESLHGRK